MEGRTTGNMINESKIRTHRRNCVFCGKEFLAKTTGKYCIDCNPIGNPITRSNNRRTCKYQGCKFTFPNTKGKGKKMYCPNHVFESDR